MTGRTVCGCTPPHLAALVHRIFALGDETGEQETAELAALAVGIEGAARELRARHLARGGEHA